MLQQNQIQQNSKPKHIIVSTSTAGTIIYTVPTGKRFKGTPYITGAATATSSITINGVSSGRITSVDLSSIYSKSPLELYEGDTFTFSALSSESGLVGVEYDA